MAAIADVYIRIVSELRKNPGRKLNDLSQCVPQTYSVLDMDISDVVIPYVQQLIEWGWVEAYSDNTLLTVSDLHGNSFHRANFYISKNLVDMEEILGFELGTQRGSIFG